MHMNDTINPRIETVLRLLSDGLPHGRQEVAAAIQESPSTANRLLRTLLMSGWIAAEGSARARRYVLAARGRVEMCFDLDAYLRRPPAERAVFTTAQPVFFDLFEGSMP